MTTQESKKLDELAKSLERHIKESCVVDQVREEKIDKLMPLADLIPMLQQVIKERETNIAVNERFASIARIFLTIGGVIGAMYAIAKLILRIGE
jgi:oligoribonuclease (3'-5' exoribonuclease)